VSSRLSDQEGKLLWGGRFEEPVDKSFLDYSTSIEADRRLYIYEIAQSIAHARMLAESGILSAKELNAIEHGLFDILNEFLSGTFTIIPTDEDIHTAVERRLTELVPDLAPKLHAGRSRNEQIVVDLRLFCKFEGLRLLDVLLDLIGVLGRRSAEERTTLMPGYTHMQRAQPITLGYWFAAYAEGFIRDVKRLKFAIEQADVCPSGAAALAGSTLDLDLHVMERELGFSRSCFNFMDAVSDREFVAELIYACSTIMLHISRLAEEVILWSTKEFGFVKLPDALSTGSSLMPQKRNPDLPELARGRTAAVLSSLFGLLTLIKSLPFSYNRDFQENTRYLYQAVDVTYSTLKLVKVFIDKIDFDREAMAVAADDPHLLATDVAEALVRNGVPFRHAHQRVGKTLLSLEKSGNLSIGRLMQELEIQEKITPEQAIIRRKAIAGPSPDQVASRISIVEDYIRNQRNWLTLKYRVMTGSALQQVLEVVTR